MFPPVPSLGRENPGGDLLPATGAKPESKTMPRKKPHTALSALREAYASTWGTDQLAKDYATQALVDQGADETEARAQVDAAFTKHFKIFDAN